MLVSCVTLISADAVRKLFSTIFVDGIFQNLPHLRVLDLSFTGIQRIPGALLRRLKSLVLLDLTRCKELRQVSDEIDSLLSLEFLSLLDCFELQKLPRVNKLRNLKLYLTTVPPQKDRGEGRNAFIGWVPWQPRRVWSRSGIPYALPANLRRLELFGTDLPGKYSFDVAHLGNMEKLTLRGMRRFSTSMVELHCLKVLKIISCFETPVPPLGNLPLLEDLDMTCDSTLGIEAYGCEGAFPSLKNFWISCQPGMEKMFVFHRGTMPKIESLRIDMSRKQHFPTSITELRTLKIIKVTTVRGKIIDEGLDLVFSTEDCFPCLEFLGIKELDNTDAGRKRYLRDMLPSSLLGREKEGNLKIEITESSVYFVNDP